MLLLVIILFGVSSGLLLVWMGAFEYTVFRLQHHYPAYYKSIGQPRLTGGFMAGARATFKLLQQWHQAIPAEFPNDSSSLRAVAVYRLSIRCFFWVLLISFIAFGIYS